MSESGDMWLQTRRSLLSRLKDWDDAVSWQDFFDTYSRLLYSTAARAGLGDMESQDIVQEVLIAVARQMPAFRYDPSIGSFKSWLLRITQRRIADHWRRHYREAGPGGGTGQSMAESYSGKASEEAAPGATGMEGQWDEDWERNLMEAGLRKVKATVNPKQFQVFDCYVVKGWSVREVASALGVSANQVYLARSRVGALVKAEVDRLRRDMV